MAYHGPGTFLASALFLGAATLASTAALAEQAVYGVIELTGLSREVSWPYNPPGESYAMVCDANGPGGFLNIRGGPGMQHPVQRKLKRLAILTVDTARRQGHWVRVLDAHRDHSAAGMPQAHRSLAVSGWAHDDHLCSFLD